MKDVCVQGVDINVEKQDIIEKGGGEGMEDGEEMVLIFDVRQLGMDDGLEAGFDKSRKSLNDKVM